MEKKIKRKLLVILLFLFIIFIFTSCATSPCRMREGLIVSREADMAKQKREDLALYAKSLIGEKDISKLPNFTRNDCSDFVMGVFRSIGYRANFRVYPHVREITRTLYLNLKDNGFTYRQRIPEKADIAFFRGTLKNGKNFISHIGIVTEIQEDGTIKIVHYSSTGVSEIRMNLLHPSQYMDVKGKVKNDYLKKGSGLPGEKLLSGQLFFCFGDFIKYSERR